VGRATRNAGAEPFATPAGEIVLGAFELRFWSVLLDAMCSKETVPGSERRTSNEWVSVEDCFWRVRTALTFSGGGAADKSTRRMEINDCVMTGGVVVGCDGPGCAPRGEECA